MHVACYHLSMFPSWSQSVHGTQAWPGWGDRGWAHVGLLLGIFGLFLIVGKGCVLQHHLVITGGAHIVHVLHVEDVLYSPLVLHGKGGTYIAARRTAEQLLKVNLKSHISLYYSPSQLISPFFLANSSRTVLPHLVHCRILFSVLFYIIEYISLFHCRVLTNQYQSKPLSISPPAEHPHLAHCIPPPQAGPWRHWAAAGSAQSPPF